MKCKLLLHRVNITDSRQIVTGDLECCLTLVGLSDERRLRRSTEGEVESYEPVDC